MKEELPPNTYPINAKDMSSALVYKKRKIIKSILKFTL